MPPATASAAILLVAIALGLFQTPAAAGPMTQDAFSGPWGHETDAGVGLSSDLSIESVTPAPACAPDVPVRGYAVAAINVEMTLNRFLDYDPQGRMYVLQDDLARVRSEEAQNREARAGRAEPAVSIGLQGDAIQPLTLRVNQGECLRISLRNDLKNGEPATIHVHGSGLRISATGNPALVTNPESVAQPGETVVYEWAVGTDEPEGTHMFHSHGDARNQTNHGLFGAVIVEPRGSTYEDPIDGSSLRTGWDAIIRGPEGKAFREFAFYYHEIGNERYRHLDKNDRLVVQVDPYSGSYRPGDRALNYRSEPFMNRLALQQQVSGMFDKSAPYSSYSFGDPATPIARSYLGDPVKQRLIHGGSEVFHVHHMHGGSIRWPRQPNAEPSRFDVGLDKHPPLVPEASERLDSQSIGPSETFDIVDECGSGGCQQSVGDFLYHCHIAQHYLSGMWGIWRVYNTKQDGVSGQDLMPALAELPDHAGRVALAVPSTTLAGTTVDWQGQSMDITADVVADWVERQLPPPGVPKGYDASVLDWTREGDLYLGEPETDDSWPGYTATSPGAREPLMFDPNTGKLAYPFLRPHLGKRPPFAPNHGPAPFLDPIHQGTATPAPGENGPWSLCPSDTALKTFSIDAITVPIPLNRAANIVDPSGTLFVLKDQEGNVISDDALKQPLAIRANAGEDCVDVLLRSKLQDTRDNAFLSKVDVHIHFVQFDVQASDGVNTGFNYEQSVRPFAIDGEKLVTDVDSGATSLSLTSADRFQPGAVVGIGMDQDATFEVRRIAAIEDGVLTFDEPLSFAHVAGEIVSTEFVRYRWYPDAQFGTAYFHDHVDALHSWQHGLFGAFISEPPGSSYFDPHTGLPLLCGPIADIRTSAPVTFDVTGSFREFVMFIQDTNPLTKVGDGSGSSFNLRAEPLGKRRSDPSQLFSSTVNGDPETPLLEAYVGDPIVVRNLVGGANEVHTWHLDGHWFREEPYSGTSPPIDTAHLGISERWDLAIPSAGGDQRLPGDYLYYSGRAFKLREGTWGILRVYDDGEDALVRLPGHESAPRSPPSLCPPDAIVRSFAIAAIQAPLPMLDGKPGKIYVLQSDKDAVLGGSKPPEPLTLHVNVGDCIAVTLTNETQAGDVSFHADMLAFDPAEGGVNAGFNPTSTVAPGASRTTMFYASPTVGETTATIRDWGNVVENPRLGLYGAIIVGSRGATYTDPVTGADASGAASWRVDVHTPSGQSYRDFSLFMQDEDEIIGTPQMPYVEQVRGVVGMNYRKEPLADRLKKDRDTSKVFMSTTAHGDPSTPLMEAFVGDAMRIHVLAPFSEQAHVFTLDGHEWPFEPGRVGTTIQSAAQIGALDATTFIPIGGAGGDEHAPGDYLYGDHREPFREAGLWGILRVYAPSQTTTHIRPLD